MARLTAAEREAALKREQRQREKEKKERGPSVTESAKEGVKSVGRTVKSAAKRAVGRIASASPYSVASDARRKRQIEKETD